MLISLRNRSMHVILSNVLVQSISELKDQDFLLVSVFLWKIMGYKKSKPRLWEAMRIQNQVIESVSLEKPIHTYELVSYIWMSQTKGDQGIYSVVPHVLKMEWEGKQMNPTHGQLPVPKAHLGVHLTNRQSNMVLRLRFPWGLLFMFVCLLRYPSIYASLILGWHYSSFLCIDFCIPLYKSGLSTREDIG